jgi:endonuclease/exonuclease/phosphatase family metal-dependent hydrolase
VPRTLVACTWNLELGKQLDRVVEAVGTSADFRRASVLLLQEASVHGVDDAAAIATALGPGYRSRQEQVHTLRGAAQANAIVWDSRRVAIGATRPVGLPVALIAAQPRGALVADGCLDEATTVRFVCAHLDVTGYAHRSRQLAAVLDAANAPPRPQLTLIGGDLNTFGVGGVPSWGRLRDEADAAGFTELTSGIPWTHRHRSLRIRQKLDAIFAAADRRLTHRAWTLPLDASDHLPVFAEVTLT